MSPDSLHYLSISLQGEKDWNTGHCRLPPFILNQTPLTLADQAYFEGQSSARSGYFWDPVEFQEYWGRTLGGTPVSAPVSTPEPTEEPSA